MTSTPKSVPDKQEEEQEETYKTTGNMTDGKSLPIRTRGASSPPPPLPAAPQPSADAAIHEVNAQVAREEEGHEAGGEAAQALMDEAIDIWALRQVQALELLCAYVQSLVEEPQHKLPKPPTPPSSNRM